MLFCRAEVFDQKLRCAGRTFREALPSHCMDGTQIDFFPFGNAVMESTYRYCFIYGCWASICTQPADIHCFLCHRPIQYRTLHRSRSRERHMPVPRACAGGPSKRMFTAVSVGHQSIVFVCYIQSQRHHSVYIPPTLDSEVYNPISSILSHLHPRKSPSALPYLLPPNPPPPQSDIPCPGGKIVLKHHPHRHHLHPAQPTAKNVLAPIRPSSLLTDANGSSARIVWPTHGANDIPDPQGRSRSRTHCICRRCRVRQHGEGKGASFP